MLKCLVLQDGAGPMLLDFLDDVLEWAQQHRPVICPYAWRQAVMMSRTDCKTANVRRIFMALKRLLDGIEDPLLLLIGEMSGWCLPVRLCMCLRSLQLNAGLLMMAYRSRAVPQPSMFLGQQTQQSSLCAMGYVLFPFWSLQGQLTAQCA